MDELVRKLIIYPDPYFRELLADLDALDDDTVADAASVIYLHILHPGTPVPASLPKAATDLAKWLGIPRVAAGRRPRLSRRISA